MSPLEARLVTLTYDALLRGDDLSAQIAEAFGVDGLGILTVSGVPGLAPLRERLLPLARTFARLPTDVKERYEHAPSFFSVGWSHGREKLGGGEPDFAKGSYYNNPLHNRPFDDEALIRQYPSFAAPNVWPSEHVPEMEAAFMQLGQLMVRMGLLVATQCDRFVAARCATYEPAKLHGVLSQSRACKGRLLHYFARARTEAEGAQQGAPAHGDGAPGAGVANTGDAPDCSSWCGWHNDHGSLTALVAPMYLDETSGARVPSADPAAGLYVRGRRGQLVRARIPEDHLAFQIGETAQVHTGGLLQATPHAVRGSSVPGASRETFAVFMEPEWGYPMDVPDGMDPLQTQTADATAQLPKGVPALRERWGTPECPFSACDFGQFTQATFKSFY